MTIKGITSTPRLGAVGMVLALTMVLSTAVTSKAQTFSVLHNFTGGADGGAPNASLILDKTGNLYGTAAIGGANSCSFFVGNCGVVFKVDSSTGSETVLYNFCPGGGSCTDGENPGDFLTLFGQTSIVFYPTNAPLVADAAGNLYGTTPWGGSSQGICGFGFPCGVVFKLDTAGNETVLYNFCSQTNCADGVQPSNPLILDAAGNLYGATLGEVFKIDTTGALTVLHNFTGYPTDGATAATNLVRDAQGNLYGTTYQGGAYGQGVAFKLTPKGRETLYSFPGGERGQNPYGGLIRDAQGNLYGTTLYGGNVGGASCGTNGCGTVFELNAEGREKTDLYSFTGANGDGATPYASLVRDAEGNLYGTTFAGGAYGQGTVFKVDKTGKETVLHSFCSGGFPCADGQQPTTGVVLDAAGNLYGTTAGGGANFFGVVYKITPQ